MKRPANYWIMDEFLRQGSEARNPDVLGIALETGVKWGHNRVVGQRSRSYFALSREWSKMAHKMKRMGEDALKDGHRQTAFESFYLAALYFCKAQWSVLEDSDELIDLHATKNECYDKVIELSPHPIKRVEVPFNGKSLPALLHLPSEEGEFPLVVRVPGMDQTKEEVVNVMNNIYARRGMATLAVDGPGQGETLAVRKLKVDIENYDQAGKAVMDKMQTEPKIQHHNISVFGNSFGSYWAPRIAANDSRYKSCVSALAAVEPGMKTIFKESYPTFRLRFKFMAGIEDDDEFDSFISKMDLSYAEKKLSCPVLFVAGSLDQLCPVKYVRQFHDRMVNENKLFIIYEGEFHPLGRVAPEMFNLISDWLSDIALNKETKTGWYEIPSAL